ncbi:polymorphic toxin-type HINT domain-containing protein [Actinoalloteichus sp. GBA129-24]|uniref:polymorphic toxin-type HINT domain-containing protein n=1 Tax=Actinoalloteichus sp. GBA129-24 TaxID=1612551 RepID=UPI0009F886CB|nr:polymorphic toxin-type HINT domain-containing protein [Actinoalloteichus sp. GBA129-24]
MRNFLAIEILGKWKKRKVPRRSDLRRGPFGRLTATVTATSDGGGTDTITATAEHPFWVADVNAWVNAEDLEPGHRFETADHREAAVTAVDAHDAPQQVRNLTIDRLHTYYVLAGTAPVLVHNAGECSVNGLPHGTLGENATRQRLQNEGYTNITSEVRFRNSHGNVFRADFVAQDSSGNWVATEVKTGEGSSLTDNQRVGYAELSRGGAVLNTSRLPGLKKGAQVTMRVEIDL